MTIFSEDDSYKLSESEIQDQDKLLSAYFSTGGSIKKSARRTNVTVGKANKLLNSDRVQDKAIQVLSSANVTMETVVSKLWEQASYPDTGDPADRAVNVRALEILARFLGAFNDKKKESVTAVETLSNTLEAMWKAREARVIDATPLNVKKDEFVEDTNCS